MRAVRGFLLAILLSGCSADDGTLPPGFLQDTTRIFAADFTTHPTRVQSLGGLDGSPVATVKGAPDLTSVYQGNGVRQVRVPRGTACAATLDAVFPDTYAPVDPATSFVWEPLRTILETSWVNDMKVIWQVMFDVGKGACTPMGPVELGAPVSDPDQWSQIAMAVLGQFKDLGFPPVWVEFLPDAFGAGGYKAGTDSQVFNLYEKLHAALRAKFPADAATGKSPFLLAAPSLPVTGPAEFGDPKAPMGNFVASILAKPSRAPDLLSFSPVAGLPEDHLAMARAARVAVSSWGATGVGIAALGARVSAASWAALAASLKTPADRSAWAAAHLTATRILLQGVVDLMAADRWGGPRAQGSLAGEDLFVSATGAALPALQAMLAFYLMELAKADRVPVVLRGGTQASDGHGVAALAALSADGKKAFFLVAAADPDRIGQRLTYRFEVTGLPAETTGWELHRALIDSASEDFQFLEQSEVSSPGGTLLLSRDIMVPSVQYIELVSGAATVPG